MMEDIFSEVKNTGSVNYTVSSYIFGAVLGRLISQNGSAKLSNLSRQCPIFCVNEKTGFGCI
jgi:hypothetical protein